MRLWIERPPALPGRKNQSGQPRMRLWIERPSSSFTARSTRRSASYEAVNWKDIITEHWDSSCGSASYEAVNWKITLLVQVFRPSGQPRMRLWIERPLSGSPVMSDTGQPRMRLWIESSFHAVFSLPANGQPRMRLWIEELQCQPVYQVSSRSASYEAVKWSGYKLRIEHFWAYSAAINYNTHNTVAFLRNSRIFAGCALQMGRYTERPIKNPKEVH